METASPIMAIVCVNSISVTIPHILLFTSSEPLSTTLSTKFSSDTSSEEITSSRLLTKTRQIREIPRKYSIQISNSLFPQ
jgi:hypothetical protein